MSNSTSLSLSPLHRLFTDILQRRGYPVYADPKGIHWFYHPNPTRPTRVQELLKGRLDRSLKKDLADLAEILIPTHEDWNPCGESQMLHVFFQDVLVGKINVTSESQMRKRLHALIHPTVHNHMTGPQITPSPFTYSWQAFQALENGASEPVSNLDPGIALLVKVLMEYQVFTTASCEGHRHQNTYSPPLITFFGYYQSRWCEIIFQQLFHDLPLAQRWHFNHGPESGDWINTCWQARHVYTQEDPPYTEADHQEDLEQIQIMARRLLNSDLRARVLQAKQRADTVDDLEPQLQKSLSGFSFSQYIH